MKKTIFLIFLSILLLISGVNALCCKDPNTDQTKCFPDPPEFYECNGYCYPFPCFDFEILVSEPKSRMFVVGQKTPVLVYVKNIGTYTDSYVLSYEKIPNTGLILVDMTGLGVKVASPGETIKFVPRITVSSSTISGMVNFTVTSQSSLTQKSDALNVLESEFSWSLPEFNSYGMIEIMVLVGVIYFLTRKF